MHSFRERAKKATPGGSQTRSKKDLFSTPVALSGAQFQQTWDQEGNVYTDWISGLCAISLGHGYPEVDEAVVKQIQDHGTCFSLPSYLEVEVAEQLIAALKWPEQVRWLKTGSEATMAAMMIARAATERSAIISIGYHGWHHGHSDASVIPVEWGDLGRVDWLLREPGGIAGVLLEPMRDDEPPAGYLQGVQDLCKEHGALFIVDEIVTGFRWALGGATEYYGLNPDLACYSKALGNGYPISAVVGRERHMRFADRVSSTFGGELVGLAAAGAVLGVYDREPVIAHLWDIGRQLKERLGLIGFPVYPRLSPLQSDAPVADKVKRLAEKGILCHPAKGTFCPSYSHSTSDVDAVVKAFKACAS